ncbi:MAG TPA: isoprenylcysteine carboxylmethyltransferase family protein [Roseiarcus sp.]|jgi:protein-S-isoprenylcysteine O-methyltransferase Ste14|nr:isoprenylcysteine carboxylmethyltransferase family protein [Roseiarcus sp.]
MFYRWLFISLFVVMWASWAAVWIVMARGVKQPAQSESGTSRLSHVGPLLIAAYLLAAPAPLPVLALHARFVPLAIWPPAIGAALGFAGLAFCVWARVTIAANWSSDVQLKRGHELVVAGPYRWVRHPIYTGLLMMFAGTAIAVGEWRAALAVAVATAAFWPKLGLEEALMRRQFGETYARYAARVPALIPFVG